MKVTPVSNDKAINGVEVTYYGIKFKVARDTNIHYKNALRHLMKPFQREIDKGTLDPAISERILCEAMAKGILVGWDSSTFPDNLEYTEERALELLLDDEDCRQFIAEFAADISNYLEEEKKEVVKE